MQDVLQYKNILFFIIAFYICNIKIFFHFLDVSYLGYIYIISI